MLLEQRPKRSAASLVELVVVILIVGIISAVAAPRAFDAASEARQNTTKSSLKLLRQAIEIYKARNGAYPPAATLAAALKPYLKGPFPKVLLGNNKNANVVASSQSPITVVEAGGAGWAYNPTTGEVVVNKASFITW